MKMIFHLIAQDNKEIWWQDGASDQEDEPYLEHIDSDGPVHYNAPEEPVNNTLEVLYKENRF